MNCVGFQYKLTVSDAFPLRIAVARAIIAAVAVAAFGAAVAIVSRIAVSSRQRANNK